MVWDLFGEYILGIPPESEAQEVIEQGSTAKQAYEAAKAEGKSEEEATQAAKDALDALAESKESVTNSGKIKISAPTVNAASAGASLRYPMDSPINTNADYVTFEFFEYNPPFSGRGKDTGSDSAFGSDASSSYKQYNQSAVRTGKSRYKPIMLYMPEDIQTMYSQGWGGAKFGAASIGLSKIAGTDLSAVNSAVNSVPGVVKSGIFKAMNDLNNKITGANVSLDQFMGGISKTITNPNTEMMYEGPNLRTFDLTFKLVPYSENEAKEIRKICNTFKKAMLPTHGGEAIFTAFKDAGNLLTIPSVVRVRFMKGSEMHPFLPQYKTCALSDVAINFTPDGSYATYDSGAPVATQLKLSFKEMKNIFAEEITEDGVSY